MRHEGGGRGEPPRIPQRAERLGRRLRRRSQRQSRQRAVGQAPGSLLGLRLRGAARRGVLLFVLFVRRTVSVLGALRLLLALEALLARRPLLGGGVPEVLARSLRHQDARPGRDAVARDGAALGELRAPEQRRRREVAGKIDAALGEKRRVRRPGAANPATPAGGADDAVEVAGGEVARADHVVSGGVRHGVEVDDARGGALLHHEQVAENLGVGERRQALGARHHVARHRPLAPALHRARRHGHRAPRGDAHGGAGVPQVRHRRARGERERRRRRRGGGAALGETRLRRVRRLRLARRDASLRRLREGRREVAVQHDAVAAAAAAAGTLVHVAAEQRVAPDARQRAVREALQQAHARRGGAGDGLRQRVRVAPDAPRAARRTGEVHHRRHRLRGARRHVRHGKSSQGFVRRALRAPARLRMHAVA